MMGAEGNMDFKKGSNYTRDEIHTLYFDKPVPATGTGNWTSGYVRVEEELIVFIPNTSNNKSVAMLSLAPIISRQ